MRPGRPGGIVAGGDGALSIEARWLQPDVPPELDQTYRRTFARLKGLFRARGCTPEEAADLAQEAAMRAYVHVQRWGASGDGLDPLINRIARNLLIDRHRRAAPHLVSLDAAEEVHDPAMDLDEQVLQRQRNVEVRSAVSELPERHRTAIMYSLKGMSPAEVAVKLGIGRNAADALLHRARRSLRERLRHVGEGMLGLGFWVGNKMRSGARRVGLDGHIALGGVAVDAGAGVVAAAVLAVTIGFGGGGGGVGGTMAPGTKAAVAQVAPVSSTSLSAPVSGGPAGPAGSSGASGVNLGSASAGVHGSDGNGSYGGGDGSIDNPSNPDQELLGLGLNVFEQQDNETVDGAVSEACGAADCGPLWQDPRDRR